MYLIEANIEARVIIGIAAMVLLFTSFIIAFVSNHRKKLQYHKKLLALNEEQQRALTEQNMLLEKRVHERTIALSQQKEELQKSLAELKATQLQLIQREKMASLGELTAGIAHEIQNPLNFVNNFSELNKELIEEWKRVREKLPYDPELESEIIHDLDQNTDKISYHGKRADAIVKGMLQHSRSTKGEQQPTNINALAEEYLQLAYHGYRAKEKDFNAALQTDFDNSIEKINVTPQDIGRVLLNLFTNSFYALSEKQKQQPNNYEPVILVSTKKLFDKIEITVKDNGIGIPKKVIDKIFQPFFTTKPTGQGTGLGLSLSYDIIRAHGGELKVDTKEGEYTTFTILLPV